MCRIYVEETDWDEESDIYVISELNSFASALERTQNFPFKEAVKMIQEASRRLLKYSVEPEPEPNDLVAELRETVDGLERYHVPDRLGSLLKEAADTIESLQDCV